MQESPNKHLKMGNPGTSLITVRIMCIIDQNQIRSEWFLIELQSTKELQSTMNYYLVLT